MRNLRMPPFGPLMKVIVLLIVTLISGACTQDNQSRTLRDKYQLTEEEAAKWERLYVAEAESLALAVWGHIGRREYDQAMLLVDRFGDQRMSKNFESRIQNVWAPVIDWPAADFTKEPQIGLGEGKTVGFRTWGELLSGAFQRAVLCEDSITVFFVFSGHWETETMPIYAAVACGDFGTETPQWRPFAHLVFSADASKEAITSMGQAYFARDLDEFLAFLKSRTFGSFGV